ncbi:MAG TPA: glycosyltransferase family 4 protein [Candidatus Sulfotelmatobacter sp.]|jgi:sugar transferase (PEP-CTERM/EpsH1 system associated)
MKILWVKAGGLVPTDSGGRIRSFNILRQLAAEHAVTLFSFHPFQQNDPHLELSQLFHKVICVPLRLPRPKSMGEKCAYAFSFLSSRPYNISKFCRPEARHALEELLAHETYDVIVCDFLVAAGLIPWNHETPKVLFTHNVETTIWRRHYEVANKWLWKAVSWREWKRMDAAERRYLGAADRVLAVSENDRDYFASFIDPKTISVIPTGVDIDYFAPQPSAKASHSLVFTGSMDWLPNEDAIFYFVQEILPLIREECPDVSLEIVGRNPSLKLETLVDKNPNIRLTGWVEDIRPFFANAALSIVPLRIGGGTRLKIFEAMAMGKAVVSTSIGAEGLPVQSGENILLADTPRDFARSVLSLLTDETRRKSLGAAARRLVEGSYSWRIAGKIFASELEAAAARKTLAGS